ncbi:uncharacterized protein LOC117289021 [Asterias rubens]|uniref:uncharacterized protein LOC117289021 n=1 Tax=Asterias rubens TaxID=7604 RepID=UPI00145593C3|nr:uncharacterized protein LOC117289021 [Asterias rubens]
MQGKTQGQGSSIKCQACTEKIVAVSKCVDCDDYLCPACQRAHQRMKLMKDHTLIPLQSGEPTGIKRKPSMKCKTHSNQDVTYFCETCQMLACFKCSSTDHVKPLHSLVNLKEALQTCKQEAAELVVKVENNNSELNDACDELEKTCKKMDVMFADTNEKISRKAEKEIAKAVGRIREEEQKLKQTAEESYKHRVKTIKQALTQNVNTTTQTTSKLDEVKLVMPHLNDNMLEYVKNKLLQYLEEMSNIKAEGVSDMLFFMDFEEDEDSLGKLVLEEKSPVIKPEIQRLATSIKKVLVVGKKPGALPPSPGFVCLSKQWALKTDVKTFGFEKTKFRHACNVAAFSDNEIVISEAQFKILISLNSSDQTIDFPRRLHINGLTNPSRITTSGNNNLVVLDSPDVKIFTRDYQLLRQFTPCKGTDGVPSCLAVDDRDTIAVGYKNKGEISLHSANGNLIRKLPAPMLGDFATVCRQHFIYTNEQKKLVSVNYNGKLVFSVDVPSRFSPTGVSCDTDGSIYVAVNHWASGSVHRFTPCGKYMECIIKDCRPPLNITFTPNGELVLAATDSVQIYHRV